MSILIEEIREEVEVGLEVEKAAAEAENRVKEVNV